MKPIFLSNHLSHPAIEMSTVKFTATSKAQTRGIYYLDDLKLPRCIKEYIDRSSMFYVENGYYPLEGERFKEPFEVKMIDYGVIFTSPRVMIFVEGDREMINSWSTFPQIVLCDNESEVGRYHFGKLFAELEKNYKPRLSISLTTKHSELIASLYANLTEVNTVLQLAHLFHLNLADDEFLAATSNEVFYSILCEKIELAVGRKGLEPPMNTERLNGGVGLFAPPGGFSKKSILQFKDDDGTFQPFGKTIIDRLREYVEKADVGRAIMKLIPQTIKQKPNPDYSMWMSLLNDQNNRQYGATLKEYINKQGEPASALNINGMFVINKPGLTPPTMSKMCTRTVIPSSRKESELTDVEFMNFPSSAMVGLVYLHIELNCVCTKLPSIGSVSKITKVVLRPNVRAPRGLDSAASSILEKLNLIADDIEEDKEELAADYDEGGRFGDDNYHYF